MQFIASLILAGLFFSSQDNFYPQTDQLINTKTIQNTTDETERFEQSYPFSSNGKISIRNINGSISIEAWDKNEIKFEYIKTADSVERLKELEVKIEAEKEVFRVSAEYDQWKRKNGNYTGDRHYKLQADFRLFVPKNAYLDVIETVNGSVIISKMTNTVIAKAVNGSVKGFNLRGTAKLSTVNGTSEASFDEVENNGVIYIETVNGNAILTLPTDAEATILAETLNGSITNDFGMYVKKGQYVGRDLHSKLGNGTNKIKLTSVNGGLSIRKKNDGKQPKTVTNLLSTSKDDDDYGQNRYPTATTIPPIPPININVPPINVVIPPINIRIPPIPPINTDDLKEAEKALKEAQKEFDKAKLKKLSDEELAEYEEALNEAKESLEDARRELAEAQKEMASADYNRSIARGQGISNGGRDNTSDWDYSTTNIDKKSDSIAVKGVPKVIIDAPNCSVAVRGWDKQEVSYTITKISKNQNQNPVEFEVNKTESEVLIKALPQKNDQKLSGTNTVAGKVNTRNNNSYYPENNYLIRIEVFVPKKTNLKISTDAEIRIEGVVGNLEIIGDDESINVRDSEGNLKVTNADGRVRVIGFKGELDAKTVDGEVYLEGEFSKINAKAVDGSYFLTFSENTNADITSNLEEVKLDDVDVKINNSLKIGKGGAKYNFMLEDGMVFLRKTNEQK